MLIAILFTLVIGCCPWLFAVAGEGPFSSSYLKFINSSNLNNFNLRTTVSSGILLLKIIFITVG